MVLITSDGLRFIVNSVAWAAEEFGTLLAAGSSDGSISILFMNDERLWFSENIPKAHEVRIRIIYLNHVLISSTIKI